MSSSQNKKNNDQKNYNFIYSPINIPNKIGLTKDIHENQKAKEQLAKYYFQNITTKNKTNHYKNMISQSDKNKQKISASPNNQYFFKSKIQKDTNYSNINQSKNFNETKNSEQNSKSPISLTGRITNLHNIKLNKEKNEEEEKKLKGSNIYLNNCKDNKLLKSSNIISHNSKSVSNNNNKNKNLKYGNNLIIKTGNIMEGLNNLRKNEKKNNYNFNNNNHGIINNMNNNTSKNKKKTEFSNNSNLNLGMLSFSTSNLSVNNIIPVNNHNLNNINNNESTNDLKNDKANNVKKANETEEPNKNNLNLCLDYISNINYKKDKPSSNNDEINKKNIQTKSAEQTTRNPKYFNNESIYNTNYIINVIDSNQAKNKKLEDKGKLDNKNQIYVINQKDLKNNNYNNNAYKELTDITKKNVNQILSKKNEEKKISFDKNKDEDKKNSENNLNKENAFIKKYLKLNDGQKYKNPEELHFTMVNINQNINKLKGKF